MDENLIVYGIQFLHGRGFKNRYLVYDTEEDRNRALRFFMKKENPDCDDIPEFVVPVNMIIRVETIKVELDDE